MVAANGRQLRTSQYVGYAAGDAVNNLTFAMASAFLLIYYRRGGRRVPAAGSVPPDRRLPRRG